MQDRVHNCDERCLANNTECVLYAAGEVISPVFATEIGTQTDAVQPIPALHRQDKRVHIIACFLWVADIVTCRIRKAKLWKIFKVFQYLTKALRKMPLNP